MSEHSAAEWREYSKKYQTLGSEPFWQDLHDVIADLAACEAERDEAIETITDWENDYSKKRSIWQNRAEVAEQAALTAIEQREVVEIRAKGLVKYTNHTIPCAVGENKPCTCGLDAALAARPVEGEKK